MKLSFLLFVTAKMSITFSMSGTISWWTRISAVPFSLSADLLIGIYILLTILTCTKRIKDYSNLSVKVSLGINSFEDSVLEEINSEVKLKELMITLGFLEEEERFLRFELKLENARLSAFSNKPELEIEAELEFYTILTNFSE